VTALICPMCGATFHRYPSQAWPNACCSRPCAGAFRSAHYVGERAAHWRGGTRTDKDGRVEVYRPDHPHANAKGYVWRARLVAERAAGRLLEANEVVHHRDGNPSNDAPDNLAIFPSQAEHARQHGRQRTAEQMAAMRAAKKGATHARIQS
jgi:hypothetical protein